MLIENGLYSCVICCKTENRDYRKITSECTHKAIVCLECVNKYIENDIITSQSNQSIKITCPTPTCDKLMERNDIKNIASKEIFERFIKFLCFISRRKCYH